jgi:apolipoprotein N-acyltransferase
MPSTHRTTHVALPRTGIRSVPAHLILLGASAVLLVLAFPPYGFAWLAYLALWPAGLLAARAASARQLAWTSFVVFWAAWLFLLSWLIPVTGGGYAVLAALMAAYWSLALLITHALHKRYHAAMIVLLPMAWVASEFVRGRFLAGGFGWFALGHSQASYTTAQSAGRIIQTADLFGELGVSLIVAMTSGLLVDLMTHPLVTPIGQNKHRIHRTIRGALILWILVMSASWFYGQYRIDQWEQSTTPGPRIAVIQTNVPQNNKTHSTPTQDAENWRRMTELTHLAADASPTPDLIVWPETMVPKALNPKALDFYRQMGGGSEIYHQLIRETAQSVGTNLIVGSPSYEGFVQENYPDGSTGYIPKPRYNSVFLYYADGEQSPLRYDKMHRVPFGEFIPWVSAIPPIKSLFLKWFTPYDQDYSLAQGTSLTVFDVPIQPHPDPQQPKDNATPSLSEAKARVSPTSLNTNAVRTVTPICYEDAVARVVRKLVYQPNGQKRADLLVNLTNSAWYPNYAQQPQQLQIATIRCIENRVPMARSVNGGISGFIDSLGRLGPLVEVGGQHQWVDGFATDQPRLDSRLTLYGTLGDTPIGSLAALTALLLLWGKIVPRKIRK